MRPPQQDLREVLEKYGYSFVNEQRDNWTPLMNAVLVSDRRSVQILLDNGADLEIKDEEGRTALYIATEYAITDMTHMLLDRGANIHVKNADGYTPLECAKFCEDLYAGSDTGNFYARIRQMLEAKAIQNPPPALKAIMPPPPKKRPSRRFTL